RPSRPAEPDVRVPPAPLRGLAAERPWNTGRIAAGAGPRPDEGSGGRRDLVRGLVLRRDRDACGGRGARRGDPGELVTPAVTGDPTSALQLRPRPGRRRGAADRHPR